MVGDMNTGTAAAVAAQAALDGYAAMAAVAPGGWRVELVDGHVRVTPQEDAGHAEIVASLAAQLGAQRADAEVRSGVGPVPVLALADAEMPGRVLPDLVLTRTGATTVTAASALLVAEVTMKATGNVDRVEKVRAYARAGVAAYLLVDRHYRSTTLFTRPSGARYIQKDSVPFGERLALPAPLEATIDTAVFPAPVKPNTW
ncbi:hypothetical protein GCM10010417_12430 [Streptomyces carpaticus]